MTVTVVCVHWGDYQGRGTEYVQKLRMATARNLKVPHEFVVHKPQLENWWGKVELFQPGRFKGRVLFMDLDTVVTGPLDELAEHKGTIYLDRWGWPQRVLGSSALVWDAGEHHDIWERFTPMVPWLFKGDQEWMTHVGGWDEIPAHLTRSFRYHCGGGVPAGCVHVSCHGRPKPHEIDKEWVRAAWRI